MALTNMESINGYLEAINDNAVAISEPRQKLDAGHPDFEILRNISMDSELINIQSQITTPETDTAIIDQALVEVGDELVIVKNDNSIDSITIGTIDTTIENKNIVPVMTSNTEPSGVVSGSVGSSAYKSFDRDTATSSGLLSSNSYFTYEFETAKTCIGINLYYSTSVPVKLKVSASNDNTNWVTMIVDGLPDKPLSDVLGYIPFDFINTDSYKFYKLEISNCTLHILEYLQETPAHRIDTTAVTAGETVTKCYLPSQTLKINNVDTVEDITTRRLGTEDNLLQKIDYSDLTIPPASTLTLEVGLKSFGNKAIRVDVESDT